MADGYFSDVLTRTITVCVIDLSEILINCCFNSLILCLVIKTFLFRLLYNRLPLEFNLFICENLVFAITRKFKLLMK